MFGYIIIQKHFDLLPGVVAIVDLDNFDYFGKGHLGLFFEPLIVHLQPFANSIDLLES